MHLLLAYTFIFIGGQRSLIYFILFDCHCYLNVIGLPLLSKCYWTAIVNKMLSGVKQGFMQEKIIASHTCFGGHMMLSVKPVYKLLNVSDDLKWTTNTHVTQFSLTFKA